jgi:hypothetical protein
LHELGLQNHFAEKKEPSRMMFKKKFESIRHLRGDFSFFDAFRPNAYAFVTANLAKIAVASTYRIGSSGIVSMAAKKVAHLVRTELRFRHLCSMLQCSKQNGVFRYLQRSQYTQWKSVRLIKF